jgi:uncharacterized membrane protein
MSETLSDTRMSRIGNLSDTIFGFSMTLLVLDLVVPSSGTAKLLPDLLSMWPNFFGYLISFALLGIYWRAHLLQFKYIRKSDHNSQWINLIFLWSVTLLPFSTKLLSTYPMDFIPVSIYAGNLVLIGSLQFLQWSYATKDRRLIDAQVPEEIIRQGKLRCMLAPAGYLGAIILSFVNPILSLMVFVVIPLIYIIPGAHHLWLHKNDKTKESS